MRLLRGCVLSVCAVVASVSAEASEIAAMQVAAEQSGTASWGYWGDQPERYVSYSSHSNRLIPVYSFGISLSGIDGANSIYRDAERLTALYGQLPEATLNPEAEYFDQTDIHALQLAAADAALYDDPALYTKLPDSGISYAKGAITGHERMVEAIKNIQFARVEHRGRVALIGRDCAGEKLNQLEKILYRK